jgi:hypothetical protein
MLAIAGLFFQCAVAGQAAASEKANRKITSG